MQYFISIFIILNLLYKDIVKELYLERDDKNGNFK